MELTVEVKPVAPIFVETDLSVLGADAPEVSTSDAFVLDDAAGETQREIVDSMVEQLQFAGSLTNAVQVGRDTYVMADNAIAITEAVAAYYGLEPEQRAFNGAGTYDYHGGAFGFYEHQTPGQLAAASL